MALQANPSESVADDAIGLHATTVSALLQPTCLQSSMSSWPLCATRSCSGAASLVQLSSVRLATEAAPHRSNREVNRCARHNAYLPAHTDRHPDPR